MIEADKPLMVLETGMPGEPETTRRLAALSALLAPLGYQPILFDYDGALRLDANRPGHANVAFVPGPSHAPIG
jgi:hypothetical protein